MQIKGAKNGKPVEYSPEEKPEVMVKAHIPMMSPDTEVWWVEPKSIKISDTTHTYLGTFEFGYAKNSYRASGEFILRRLKLENDALLRPEKKAFKITFRDTLDKNGIPDLGVDSFEFT